MKYGVEIEGILLNKQGYLLYPSDIYILDDRVGCDGWSIIAELRTEPEEPGEIAKNIRNIYKQLFFRIFPLRFQVVGHYERDQGVRFGIHVHNNFARLLSEGEFELYDRTRYWANIMEFLTEPWRYRMWEKEIVRLERWKNTSIRKKPWGYEYRLVPGTLALDPEALDTIIKLAEWIVFNAPTGARPFRWTMRGFRYMPAIRHWKDLRKDTVKQFKIIIDILRKECFVPEGLLKEYTIALARLGKINDVCLPYPESFVYKEPIGYIPRSLIEHNIKLGVTRKTTMEITRDLIPYVKDWHRGYLPVDVPFSSLFIPIDWLDRISI